MNTTKDIKRPILRYHGGKYILAPWIISHFPPHRVYVEPMGGGGSVLLRKERSYCEVYNDKWDTVVNVFKIMRDPTQAEELERVLRLTPYARAEFMQTGDVCLAGITDPVEKARRTIYRSFAGFGSAATNAKYATGFRSNSNRSGSTPAHDWARYPDNLHSFTERLKGVVIENKDWKDVCTTHDTDRTLMYLDPPYMHDTRNMKRGNAAYAHEFSNTDHIDMAAFCKTLKADIAISGYRNDLYDALFKDWSRFDKDTFADGASKRTESLWVNYAYKL